MLYFNKIKTFKLLGELPNANEEDLRVDFLTVLTVQNIQGSMKGWS